MKATAHELRIMARMKPGIITLNGFLGEDRRNLNDIIHDDAIILDRLGHTSQAIAARLDYFSKLSWESFGEEVLIDEIYQVKTDVVRGKLPCPYGHPGVYRKAVTMLVNISNGLSAQWTSLSIHLIDAHGFFEGKGSPFRLDPEDLINTIY